MATKNLAYPILIIAAGVTESVPVSSPTNLCLLYTGTVATTTLLGNVTITPSGSPTDTTIVRFKIVNPVALGGKNFTIFGRNLLQYELDHKCIVECYYDGGIAAPAWDVKVFTPDNAEWFGLVLAESTDTAPDYLDGKIQKSIVIDAAAHAIELDGDEAAPGVNMTYGTDAAGAKGWQPLTGGVLLQTTLILSDAQVLTGNSVPVKAINNPGVGYYIKVLDAIPKFKVNAAPYATNTTAMFITDTADIGQKSDSVTLLSTVVRNLANCTDIKTGNTTDLQIIANKAVYWQVETGDPTGGDATNEIEYNITYYIGVE